MPIEAMLSLVATFIDIPGADMLIETLELFMLLLAEAFIYITGMLIDMLALFP